MTANVNSNTQTQPQPQAQSKPTPDQISMMVFDNLNDQNTINGFKNLLGTIGIAIPEKDLDTYMALWRDTGIESIRLLHHADLGDKDIQNQIASSEWTVNIALPLANRFVPESYFVLTSKAKSAGIPKEKAMTKEEKQKLMSSF